MLDRLRTLGTRLRWMVQRRRAEAEMEAELQFHLEMEAAKHERAGATPAEARRQARVAFGSGERVREELRARRQIPVLEALVRDVHWSVRSMARAPGLTLTAALTIAIGVGATTAGVSVVNALLLRRPPVPAVGDVVAVQELRRISVSTGFEGVHVPYERYRAYAVRSSEVVADLAAHRYGRVSLRLAERTLSVPATRVSANYFRALGVHPALGRFPAREDLPEVVLSYALWRERFGASADALGTVVHVDGRPFTVAAVAPAWFRGPLTGLESDVWIPLRASTASPGAPWAADWVAMLGRLRPGVTRAGAGAAVHAIARSIPPEGVAEVDGARVEPLSGVVGEGRRILSMSLMLLVVLGGLLLLIASVNVAGALLARSLARRRELALRLALGAGRSALVRQLLTESVLLFLAGGLAGVVLAWFGTEWLARLPRAYAPSLTLELQPDGRVLAFALVLAATTGIGCGLLPALRASRPDLHSSLKAGGRHADHATLRLRTVFVGAQVAASVFLLVLAVLCTRSFRQGLSTDPGFDPNGVVVAAIDLSAHDYSAPAARAFRARVAERVRELEGVRQVSWAQFTLLGLDGFGSDVTVPEADPALAHHSTARWNVVDTAFFRTVGVRLEAGRGFTAADDSASARVAIINRTLAQRLWGAASPLGRRIRGSGHDLEVIGVVGDSKYTFLAEKPSPFIFVPAAQHYRAGMQLHVRAPGREAAVLGALENIIRSADANVAIESAAPLAFNLDRALFPHRLAAQVVSGLGGAGLLLALVGLFGVLSYQVAQRTYEFGVRKALGARDRDVWRQIAGRAVRVTAVGCAIGMVLGLAAASLARAFLIGVRPLDPLTLMAVPLLLASATLAALIVPALRATSVSALEALRTE